MRLASKYGLLVAIALIAIRLAIYYLDLSQRTGGALLDWAGNAILGVGIFMALRDRRSLQQNKLSYGEGLGTGTLTSLMAGLFTAVGTYIHAKFLDHHVTEQLYAAVEPEIERVIDDGNFPDEQVDMMLQVGHMITSPGGIAFSYLLETFIIGFIISLIIAAVMRKEDIFTTINRSNRDENPDNE